MRKFIYNTHNWHIFAPAFGFPKFGLGKLWVLGWESHGLSDRSKLVAQVAGKIATQLLGLGTKLEVISEICQRLCMALLLLLN